MKKKKGLKRFNLFNISNKFGYTLIVILTIVLLGIGVYAYGGTSPSTVGHTTGEIMPSCTGLIRGTSGSANSWSCIPSPPTCSSGQALTYDGSAWACITPTSTQGTAIYKCPADSTSTNYCANVQLTRNGVGPCIGQLATQPSGCFKVDANCAFVDFGTCTLVGHLMP